MRWISLRSSSEIHSNVHCDIHFSGTSRSTSTTWISFVQKRDQKRSKDQKTSGQRMESFGEVPEGSYKASDVIACDDLLIETHDT